MKLASIKKALACIFILIGGFGIPTALLSLASPFSESATPAEALLGIGIYVAMLVIGIWLAIKERGSQKSHQGD